MREPRNGCHAATAFPALARAGMRKGKHMERRLRFDRNRTRWGLPQTDGTIRHSSESWNPAFLFTPVWKAKRVQLSLE
jgi:hypothetical protein